VSSTRIVRPRRLLLASATLTCLSAFDLPLALAQQAREPVPPVEVSPAQSRKQARPAGRDAQSTRRAVARRPATASAAPKPVVPTVAAQTPLNTNVVPESASRLGLTVREIPATVEVISAETMREQGYNLGGEPSGHIILSDHTTTGDGFVAALQVMAVIKKRGEAVSTVCHRYDPLPQVTKNVRYKNGKPHQDARVRDAIAEGEHRLNGHGRLIVRPSGTEPVIRVTAEGDDKELVETVVDGIVNALNEVAA